MFHDSQMSSHPLPNYPRWWWMGIEQWNPMSLEEKQEWYQIRDENVELLTDKKTKQQCKVIIGRLNRAKDSDKTRIWNEGMQRYTYWDFRLQSASSKNSFIIPSRLPVSQPKTGNPFMVRIGLSISDIPTGHESAYHVSLDPDANPYIVDVGANWFIKLIAGKQKAQEYDCNMRMNEIMSAMCQGGDKWDVKRWWHKLDKLEYQIDKFDREDYGHMIPLNNDEKRQEYVHEWLHNQIHNIAKERKQNERDVADMINKKSAQLLNEWNEKRSGVEFESKGDISKILHDMYHCSLRHR
jgi:hypothetical protein